MFYEDISDEEIIREDDDRDSIPVYRNPDNFYSSDGDTSNYSLYAKDNGSVAEIARYFLARGMRKNEALERARTVVHGKSTKEAADSSSGYLPAAAGGLLGAGVGAISAGRHGGARAALIGSGLGALAGYLAPKHLPASLGTAGAGLALAHAIGKGNTHNFLNMSKLRGLQRAFEKGIKATPKAVDRYIGRGTTFENYDDAINAARAVAGYSDDSVRGMSLIRPPETEQLGLLQHILPSSLGGVRGLRPNASGIAHIDKSERDALLDAANILESRLALPQSIASTSVPDALQKAESARDLQTGISKELLNASNSADVAASHIAAPIAAGIAGSALGEYLQPDYQEDNRGPASLLRDIMTNPPYEAHKAREALKQKYEEAEEAAKEEYKRAEGFLRSLGRRRQNP